jgi:hypothetical protein
MWYSPGGGGPSIVSETTESPLKITSPNVRLTSFSSEIPCHEKENKKI